LVEASSLEPPEKLVEAEFEHRIERFREDLERAGLTMTDYEREAQMTELEIRRDLRDHSRRSVKAELLLEEVARAQGIQVEEEEIGKEVAVAAARAGQNPKDVAKQIVDSGRLGSVVADIMRRKALEYVVENVKVTGRRADAG
jgi:trigger factor